MQRIEELKSIPDDELLGRLAALLEGSRRTEADLVAHIGEIDARRLYAREATPSMFAYCLERLHLLEHEAYLRIAAGRASREHPVLLEMLADGRLHLSGVALLAPHLTPENRAVLLRRATHKTKRHVEALVAELVPRADVSSSIRKLPPGRLVVSSGPAERAESALERSNRFSPRRSGATRRPANYVRSKWIRVVWRQWSSFPLQRQTTDASPMATGLQQASSTPTSRYGWLRAGSRALR
jgi:hypothetical protein